jgi:DUF1680 family protein/alpha-L-arabinofuranosidase
MKLAHWLLGGCVAGLALGRLMTVAAADYPVRAVPFTDVQLADSFWSPRLATNRVTSIPYAFGKCEETGRIDNFAAAGKLKAGKFQGLFFNDSDVFKVIEGASYSLATYPDAGLSKYLDELISKIAAAQEPDGYLYTARTLCGPDYMPPGGRERWSDMGGGHELYNVGHLYEAAVAHFMATGKRSLLEVAIKNANLVCAVFGPGRNTHPCGHPEVEIGLVKLYRATRDERYLQLAKFFIDTRGRAGQRELYGEYAQDHQPILEQTEAVGHSVRAAYLYSGVADVAALTGEAACVQAIDRLWENVITRKMYLTGGIGARGGSEGFGDNYELPNLSAYGETCAAIAQALWNERMFLLHGDAKYLDVLERVVFNGFLAGVSLQGDRFFYPNPLESVRGGRRSPWFDCACCPANVVRFVPSLPGYAYAHQGDDVYVNLFLGSRARVQTEHNLVQVSQETRYPWDGHVKLEVNPRDPARFAVRIRIPGWTRNQPVPGDLYRNLAPTDEPVKLSVNGQPEALTLEKGFARLLRTWKAGDVIELELPMPIRRVVAHEKVAADAGRVALERGPIVFCAEGADISGGRVLNLLLPDDAVLRTEFRENLLGGVQVLRGDARAVSRDPQAQGKPVAGEKVEFTAIPYYAWAHRRPGPMAVWLAREAAAAKPLPGPTTAFSSKVTVSGGTGIDALNDQLEPASSIDHANPFFHWWPRKGTREWVQYEFKLPVRVSGMEIYWFDDTGMGECRLPQSWRLQARVHGRWQEVASPSGFGIEKDRFNRTTFDPVAAEALRLEVQLPDRFSAGIHEWRILPEYPVAGEVLPPRVHVDAAQRGEPISPYIFGQFIEHLGRCIYGGIWAEMLEDRKFFLAVGANGSPWKVIGSPEALTMTRQGVFVGEHTPQVTLAGDQPRGISQGGLALQPAKSYVGRIWLAGSPGAGPVSVSLNWGSDPASRQTITITNLTADYSMTPLRFTPGGATDDGRLEITAQGAGSLRIGTVSLMPSDNIQGMRADTLALLKELDSPVYRWPGGNFVSGYQWTDGIGERDRRPPRKNPAWRGIEHNDFGLDEFMAFCRWLGTEPYIAVNSGLGDARTAVEEVQYANGGADTPMGKRRADNGHPEPYHVKFWSIGNEMYGDWQLGHMSQDKYTRKHNDFAAAMRAVDPAIQLIAVGDAGKWSEGMMQQCADHMDFISEHFYCQERPDLAEHMLQIPTAVRAKSEAHRRYRKEFDSLKGKNIRIALDEWNYWYGPHVFGELGTRYFLKDALGIAAGLHEMGRNSDMFFMANYAQTVNVIGCIKTSKKAAAFETTGLVLKLYRQHFGVTPVATSASLVVDAQAAWSADRKTLTLGIVNPSRAPVTLALEVKGARLSGSGTRWQIAGPDPRAYNDPDQPPNVRVESQAVAGIADTLTVAGCSVTLFALDAQPGETRQARNP